MNLQQVNEYVEKRISELKKQIENVPPHGFAWHRADGKIEELEKIHDLTSQVQSLTSQSKPIIGCPFDEDLSLRK